MGGVIVECAEEGLVEIRPLWIKTTFGKGANMSSPTINVRNMYSKSDCCSHDINQELMLVKEITEFK